MAEVFEWGMPGSGRTMRMLERAIAEAGRKRMIVIMAARAPQLVLLRERLWELLSVSGHSPQRTAHNCIEARRTQFWIRTIEERERLLGNRACLVLWDHDAAARQFDDDLRAIDAQLADLRAKYSKPSFTVKILLTRSEALIEVKGRAQYRQRAAALTLADWKQEIWELVETMRRCP